MSFSTGRGISYTYDRLGRLLGKSVSTETPLQYNYRYHLSARNEEGKTTYKTTLLMNELFGNEGYQYDYDQMGNIIKIREGTRVAGSTNLLEKFEDKVTYVYDDQNQLIRENNLYLKQTIVYTYDDGGNIEKKSIYAYTTDEEISTPPVKEILYTYETEWKDRLVSYDGEAIQYDEIGNPTEYRGNDLDWTGRRLDSLTTEDGTIIDYTYNADGIRTKKTVGDVTSEYYYSNGQLAYEKRGDIELYYLYDAEGQLAVINYVKNGSSTSYYVMVNSRGDIEALYNGQGVLQAQYRYDSWGKMISVKDDNGNEITDSGHIGNVNPFRYRGYYYDAETGFYYVSSRYYDPEVGRWLNADGYITTGQGVLSYNMFAYCLNNPVNRVDYTGNSSSALKWWSSTMWWLCGADSILPFGDALYVGGMLVLGAVALGTASNTTLSIPKTTSKTKEKTKEKEKAKVATKSKSQSTPIYRYGKTNPGNLTPKPKDKFTGLSFSTTPPPAGMPAAVTTMGALNSTGKVIAIQDGPTHVSVIPAPHMGTLQNWIDTGSAHPCTEAVRSVVIKWDGGY